MKRLIYILLVIQPFLSSAQKAFRSETKADTVITKDPLKSGREYCIIYGWKGNIKSQGFLLNGKKDGSWREYNELNGEVLKISEYSEDALNGASITFNNSGFIQTDETYSNNKKNGQRISFGNFGGRMKLLENYKDDVLEGMKKTFYDDGKIQEEGNYKNGQRDGLTTWYLQNGNRSMEYNYINGNIEGPAKVFDEAGRLKQEGMYKNNNEEGEWKEYNDSVLVKRMIYKQGKVVKEIPVKK
jgi:antitoxin component YwqK of YwqJK toxin-antitoxin module